MNLPSDDPGVALRKSVYTLLIVLGTGVVLGRILAVDSVDSEKLRAHLLRQIPRELEQRREELESRDWPEDRILRELERTEAGLQQRARVMRPFLSANDRSRWCTLRALVEPEMRVWREFEQDGKTYAQWVPYAIDKVIAERGWDTIDMVKHARKLDGDGREYLYSSKPPLLPTLIAVPYWIIHRLTGATLGTHPYEIGRFMLVLVNLAPLVVYFVLIARLVERFGTSDWGRIFVMAAATLGTFLTTFAIVLNNHLPGAVSALVAIYATVRICFDGERRLRYFALAGMFSAFTAACELPALALFGALGFALLWKSPRGILIGFVPAALLVGAGFFWTNWVAHQDLRPPYAHRSEGDNWYDYEYKRRPEDSRTIDSYWRDRIGIDRGEERSAAYVLHVLVGHHGIFSLTPVWLLSFAGTFIWLSRRHDKSYRQMALLFLAVSLVCLLFYLSRPQDDRNYGGMTCAFRWMFWFAPIWLVSMLPAADALSRRRWTRGLALVMLAISVLSAAYPTWNPWTHPWLLDYFHYLGWITV